MSFLKNVRIRTKILALILSLNILAIAGLAYTLLAFNDTNDRYYGFVSGEAAASLLVARASANMNTLGYKTYQAATYEKAGRTEREPLEEFERAAKAGIEQFREAAALLPMKADEIAQLEYQYASISNILQRAINAQQNGNDEQAIALREEANAALVKMSGFIREFNTRQSKLIADASADMNSNTNHAIMLNTIGMAIIVALGILVSLYVSQKGITGPLATLRQRMETLAEGDFDVAIEGQDRKDEIGDMAKAVEIFKENGIRARELEAQTTALREANEMERARAEAEKERLAAEDKIAIEALNAGLSALADGDLTHRITAEFPERTVRLKNDYNGSIEKLQQTLLTITASIGTIHAGTNEISTAADDLSRRTEQQAASLEETAAALDQITSTVKNTAEGAVHARDVVSVAKSGAEKSGEVVRQAIDAMGMIEKSSDKISQIIGVIDEIAFQTNLLALNAGVEAARAGDAGRGFAVVASEVRALAQRSAEAAKEIKNLISASTMQVGEGVDLVAETGKALERIVTQVTEINSVVINIAASAHEQSTGLEQVNSAVNQMDQVTQQNAAMVEESTAASHSLAQETEELSRLIAAFKLGNVAVLDSSRRDRQASRPVVKAAVRSAAPRLATAGNTALAEEGWEEF
ncbi:MAG: methyl-accepting chemotaxis protein [Phyllobacterium sp.]